MPGSAAALGLGKEDRAKEGKTTSVLGQIFISSILPKGGDGKDVVATFGGQLPPHISVNVHKSHPRFPILLPYSPVLLSGPTLLAICLFV